MIEVSEVEAHLALAGYGDLDQPAPECEAVEGVAEHDAADQVEDDIRALPAGRRADFGRQTLRAENQLFSDAIDRRVRMRRVPVGTNHAGFEAPGNLRGSAADAASGADQQNRLAGFKTCNFEAAPAAM